MKYTKCSLTQVYSFTACYYVMITHPRSLFFLKPPFGSIYEFHSQRRLWSGFSDILNLECFLRLWSLKCFLWYSLVWVISLLLVFSSVFSPTLVSGVASSDFSCIKRLWGAWLSSPVWISLNPKTELRVYRFLSQFTPKFTCRYSMKNVHYNYILIYM